jgi:hypothetical protein
MVKQLQKGRTAAKVYDPVQPVKDATVEATLRQGRWREEFLCFT